MPAASQLPSFQFSIVRFALPLRAAYIGRQCSH